MLYYDVFYFFLSFMLCALFYACALCFVAYQRIYNIHFKLFLNDVSCWSTFVFTPLRTTCSIVY